MTRMFDAAARKIARRMGKADAYIQDFLRRAEIAGWPGASGDDQLHTYNLVVAGRDLVIKSNRSWSTTFVKQQPSGQVVSGGVVRRHDGSYVVGRVHELPPFTHSQVATELVKLAAQHAIPLR